MSTKHCRVRRRRARLENLRVEVEAARAEGPEALWKLLKRMANSDDQQAWDAARVVALEEEERVMIAQAVAPRQAGMTPGYVMDRRSTHERSA